MKETISTKQIFVIGLMLFALFLGAGNMIFPPSLGQAAGTNIWIATLGFLVTGVGLPLLGVTAIALSGGDLGTLASRVNPKFAVIFSIVMYLAIGPFFGIPRTGTVAFEIGVTPFLPESMSTTGMPLFIYTIVFFGITFLLSLNPSKLVDRIGKILTPLLILILGGLAIKTVVTPMGPIGEPSETYASGAFFKGFLEGYLTMDTIGALVFGIVVINAIKDQGITDRKVLASATIKAGFIAAAGLALVYLSLAYLGATSISVIGAADNGGAILSGSATHLFGSAGTIILGLAITFACLTTSVGLVSASGEYFSKIFPKLSYPLIVGILSIFSMIVANVGLTQLINISLPVLIAIYPLAIVLIILSFLHNKFHGYREVYAGGLIGSGLISIIDAMNIAGMQLTRLNDVLGSILPLYNQGVGWLFPAIIGSIIGFVIATLQGSSKRETEVNPSSHSPS
ncbi:branched-chain amino acid transport system II carrier protein [Bacillus solimangrovi]|uniref:Branched-chain amino acid transport system carrier protein n=1 Tax=Bacillus solimangrovi TaxID=1305675 RepID=A0A1E5LCK3_9BACI|nr:branched-chain amino acid transport system II carrier protein [Bacillus solimangrovi]OEH91810.1 branched-chain amino acid transport system II carrier protein [Bacillus solimangrovi]